MVVGCDSPRYEESSRLTVKSETDQDGEEDLREKLWRSFD